MYKYLKNLIENKAFEIAYNSGFNKDKNTCWIEAENEINLIYNIDNFKNIENLYKSDKNTKKIIPYGSPTIDLSDSLSVLNIIKDGVYLTTGPKINDFENAICNKLGIKYAIAVSNGTAALHLAIKALDLKKNDEVIVPAISFVATSNAVLYENAKIIFCDVDENLLIDINKIENLITKNTRAIITMDYGGRLVNYKEFRKICDKYNIILINDAAHSFGVGGKEDSCDMTTFSFHPLKNITTGEGGMVITNNKKYYDKIILNRNHGILKYDRHKYDMVELGFNYRITDIQCVLGINQLKRIDKWLETRKNIALHYDNAFKCIEKYIKPLNPVNENIKNGFHLYVIVLNLELLGNTCRDDLYNYLLKYDIYTNVHYKPIYQHTYYRKNGYDDIVCENANKMYERILSLPIYPNLTFNEQCKVIMVILGFFSKYNLS